MTPLTPNQQAAFDMREKAARVVKPTEQRPCSCDRCDCYNIDNYAAVCVWDSANEDAKRIRAIHLPPAEPDGIEAMKLARGALEPPAPAAAWAALAALLTFVLAFGLGDGPRGPDGHA